VTLAVLPSPVVLPYNIDHVGIAVHDLDTALAEMHNQYGVEPMSREVIPEQGVEEAMIAVGGSHIQLLMPTTDDSPVARFLERRGEGMHHIAFAVPDIVVALAHLRQAGAQLIDEEPRLGGGGHLIAFVHPKAFAGTLIELVQVNE